MSIISVFSAFNCSFFVVHPNLDIVNASLGGRNDPMKLTEMDRGIKLIVVRKVAKKARMVTDNKQREAECTE